MNWIDLLGYEINDGGWVWFIVLPWCYCWTSALLAEGMDHSVGRIGV